MSASLAQSSGSNTGRLLLIYFVQSLFGNLAPICYRFDYKSVSINIIIYTHWNNYVISKSTSARMVCVDVFLYNFIGLHYTFAFIILIRIRIREEKSPAAVLCLCLYGLISELR